MAHLQVVKAAQSQPSGSGKYDAEREQMRERAEVEASEARVALSKVYDGSGSDQGGQVGVSTGGWA